MFYPVQDGSMAYKRNTIFEHFIIGVPSRFHTNHIPDFRFVVRSFLAAASSGSAAASTGAGGGRGNFVQYFQRFGPSGRVRTLWTLFGSFSDVLKRVGSFEDLGGGAFRMY